MWDDQFEDLIRRHLPFLSREESMHPELKLREFGLDSLGVVDLLASLESAYSIRLTDDVLSMDTFETPGVLWAAVSGVRNVTV